MSTEYTHLTLGDVRRATAHLPDDTRVVVDGYEGGYCDARIGWVLALLGRESPYSGEHFATQPDSARAGDATRCLCISRHDPDGEDLHPLD